MEIKAIEMFPEKAGWQDFTSCQYHLGSQFRRSSESILSVQSVSVSWLLNLTVVLQDVTTESNWERVQETSLC